MIAVFAWSPWEKPTDVEWLTTYEAWSDGLDASLGTDVTISRAACETAFDESVGGPPSDTLAPVAAAVLRGCGETSAAGRRKTQEDVVRALVAVHGEISPPTQRRDVSELVRSSMGVAPSVHCWTPDAWAPFAEHYAIVRGGEEASLQAVADRASNRLDLDPSLCATLDRYLKRLRPPALSSENLKLADALVVLGHQAEHLKTPELSEPEAQCIAMQRVRALVDEAWGPQLANEIALLAWEISYPRLHEAFRSSACRDGGVLDRNPSSSAWP